MKINNLNHIEVATQEIVGGKKPKPVYVNVATAAAGALAFGKNTETSTLTGVLVISGFSSASGSFSRAVAVG